MDNIVNLLLAYGLPILLIALAVFVLFYYVPMGLWLAAFMSGVNISPLRMLSMRIRGVPPDKIVRSLITAKQAGLNEITSSSLESHHQAKGDVDKVVSAMVAAKSANIIGQIQQQFSLPTEYQAQLRLFEILKAIDLAGHNVLEVVQTAIKPKVVLTTTVRGVAKDGIELNTEAKVTIRAELTRFLGAPGEDTIVARLAEGIVSEIGSSERHSTVLESPEVIADAVERDYFCDKNTGYKILSIDIATVKVGDNIGTRLRREADAVARLEAETQAEKKRLEAIALEQQMKAKAQEARANVIQAEAELPLAMAEALRKGQLGALDFYRLQNLKADTNMRESISRTTTDGSNKTPYSDTSGD
ncbi:MAG: flotillin-like FloA family protein [Sphingobacteriales bacterium]|nr:flotillin-like FloA family protein [Sphingobacteriales bacterium]